MKVRRVPVVLLAAAILIAGGAVSAQAAKPRPPALRLTAVSPTGTAPGDAKIQLRFSAPLAPVTKRTQPRLSPSTPGTWSQPNPTTLSFTPSGAYLPETVVRITIPRGLAAANGAVLRRTANATFKVEDGSTTRLAQLLAELRYLPAHLASSAHQPRPGDTAGQLRAIFQPPPDPLQFGAHWPSELRGLWVHDPSIVLKGAVMSFESAHGLALDGVASPAVWSALLAARAHRQYHTGGYDYAMATEGSPETFTVYNNGRVVLQSAANTGIPGRGTATGTFPVYERLRSQIMRGTNPNGSHYADFVQWIAYFNGGDAVHYIARASYGSPQSLGCIELPYAAAERAWGYLPYGTLVTVLP